MSIDTYHHPRWRMAGGLPPGYRRNLSMGERASISLSSLVIAGRFPAGSDDSRRWLSYALWYDRSVLGFWRAAMAFGAPFKECPDRDTLLHLLDVTIRRINRLDHARNTDMNVRKEAMLSAITTMLRTLLLGLDPSEVADMIDRYLMGHGGSSASLRSFWSTIFEVASSRLDLHDPVIGDDI